MKELLPETNLLNDAERAVIAAAIATPHQDVKDVINAIPAKCFYTQQHQDIWKAIKICMRETSVVDLVAICHILEKNNVKPDVFYITTITSSFSSSANIRMHATYVIEQYMRRKINNINLVVNKKLTSMFEDVLTIYDQQQSHLKKMYQECYAIIKKVHGSGSSSLMDVVEEELTAMEKDVDAGTVSGIPYGIPNMDGEVDLMVPGDMIVIAARPGMGKTILAVQIAIHAALVLNIKTHFHSLEMTRSKLAQRIISMHTSHTTNDILYRKVPKEEIKKTRALLRQRFNDNLQLFDDVTIDTDQIAAEGEKDNAKMIILDYLQLVDSKDKEKKGFREGEVSAISRGVKKTAMALKLPFIALSQLSRKVEERSSTQFRPILSDLRESGSIEQDADTVLFLYRASEYPSIKNTKHPKNVTEIIVAKQRNGKKPTVPTLFDESKNQFTYYDNKNKDTGDGEEIDTQDGADF